MKPEVLEKGSKTEVSDPLDQIPRPKDIPELEALLFRYRGVFPADLPAKLPPEREISMKIPIQAGSVPPCQAPYWVHEEAKKTVEETLKYLYEHGSSLGGELRMGATGERKLRFI